MIMSTTIEAGFLVLGYPIELPAAAWAPTQAELQKLHKGWCLYVNGVDTGLAYTPKPGLLAIEVARYDAIHEGESSGMELAFSIAEEENDTRGLPGVEVPGNALSITKKLLSPTSAQAQTIIIGAGGRVYDTKQPKPYLLAVGRVCAWLLSEQGAVLGKTSWRGECCKLSVKSRDGHRLCAWWD